MTDELAEVDEIAESFVRDLTESVREMTVRLLGPGRSPDQGDVTASIALKSIERVPPVSTPLAFFHAAATRPPVLTTGGTVPAGCRRRPMVSRVFPAILSLKSIISGKC